jgi:hypothetical protein
VALALVAAAVGLLAPAAAVASDQSVYDAYVSRDSDFSRLGSDLGRTQRRWERSGHTRQAPVLKVLRRGHTLIASLVRRVKAESPSSSNGKHGKRYALATLTFMDRSFYALARGIRARTAGRLKTAKREMADWRRLDRSAGRAEKRARKWFKAAGVHLVSLP